MAWDESKHPRDDDGKFTNGTGAPRTFRQNAPYGEILGLDYFSEKKSKTAKSNATPPPPQPREAFGFANKERLNTDHHVKHAREMGFKDQKEYERAAIEFWSNGSGKKYFGIDGHFYKYDESTNRFVSVNKDGYILTFFIYNKNKFERKRVQLRLYEI
nr:hypothetical protein [Clostridia bacterium]